MTNGTSTIATASVLVESPNQNTISSETINLYGQVNVTGVLPTGNMGVYEVTFADVFSDYPVVNVTQHFNEVQSDGHTLYPVTENTGGAGGGSGANANIVFVAQNQQGTYYCHVKTGDASSNPLWRSFALTATGPAK